MNTVVKKGENERFKGRPGVRSDVKKAYRERLPRASRSTSPPVWLKAGTIQMALRQSNPVTPSLRGTILIVRSVLWKGKPVKALTEGQHGSGGRNNHGHTTTRFRGGGHKKTLPCGSISSSQV